MKAILLVARRELVERRMAILLALAAGLVPLLVPLLTGTDAGHHGELRGLAALLLSMTFGAAYAVAFGATALVPDLTERRLGFYFARPVSAFAIWGGKLGAAWALAFAGTVLVALPTCLVDGPERFFGDRIVAGLSPHVVLGAALAVLVLVMLSHVGSSIARLRSPWLVLDALLLPVVLGGGSLALRPLLFSGFFSLSALWAVAGLLVVVSLAASFVQVAEGRTDVGRSHGALSVTFWALSITVIVLFGAVATWIQTATPLPLAVP
jgi:hypothetical protein